MNKIAKVNVSGSDKILLVNNKVVHIPQGIPIEISTSSNMDALLIAANEGKVYKYIGISTSDYVYGRFYVVKKEADSTYVYLEYLATPTDSLSITENGTYDVIEKASAIVNVEALSQSKTLTLGSAAPSTVTPDSGYLLSSVPVSLDTSIIKAANIASGVTMLGIAGTHSGGGSTPTVVFNNKFVSLTITSSSSTVSTTVSYSATVPSTASGYVAYFGSSTNYSTTSSYAKQSVITSISRVTASKSGTTVSYSYTHSGVKPSSGSRYYRFNGLFIVAYY